MKRFVSPKVAVVGATGAVGRTMQAILEERELSGRSTAFLRPNGRQEPWWRPRGGR